MVGQEAKQGMSIYINNHKSIELPVTMQMEINALFKHFDQDDPYYLGHPKENLNRVKLY